MRGRLSHLSDGRPKVDAPGSAGRARVVESIGRREIQQDPGFPPRKTRNLRTIHACNAIFGSVILDAVGTKAIQTSPSRFKNPQNVATPT
jgi:hypothetical protein